MDDWQRILIAVNDSDDALRAIHYVGQTTRLADSLYIHLLYVYPDPPPDMKISCSVPSPTRLPGIPKISPPGSSGKGFAHAWPSLSFPMAGFSEKPNPKPTLPSVSVPPGSLLSIGVVTQAAVESTALLLSGRHLHRRFSSRQCPTIR